MRNIETFNNDEARVILEAISNISYVFPSKKSEDLLKSNEVLLNELQNHLLKSKEEDLTIIHKKYFPIIRDVLELSIKTLTEDEISTYTSQTKSYIQELIYKIKSSQI